MIAVPDASAVYEYLAKTPAGARAAGFLDGAALVAPMVMDVEVLSVIRGAAMRGELTPTRADHLLLRLSQWNVFRLPVEHLIRPAFQMRDNFTPEDALYVLVARQARATLVTADGRLARAPGLGVAVHYLPTD